MLPAIDADTHLFASTQAWNFLDEARFPRRPKQDSGVLANAALWLHRGRRVLELAGGREPAAA
jgi:hypothetical protein